MNETWKAKVEFYITQEEKDAHTQLHTRTRKYAAETNEGARTAVPRDASYVWRDQTGS